MVNPQIGVRLTPEQLRIIDNLIESGDFGNRSEFVQYAVRKLLKEIGEDWRRLPPPMIKGQSRPIFSSRALTRFSSSS